VRLQPRRKCSEISGAFSRWGKLRVSKNFFRSLWSRDDPRYGDPWWKWLSASQEIETAAGSFDSVRLRLTSLKMTDK